MRTLGACLIRAVPQAMRWPLVVLGKVLSVAVDSNDLRLAGVAAQLLADPDVSTDEALARTGPRAPATAPGPSSCGRANGRSGSRSRRGAASSSASARARWRRTRPRSSA